MNMVGHEAISEDWNPLPVGILNQDLDARFTKFTITENLDTPLGTNSDRANVAGVRI